MYQETRLGKQESPNEGPMHKGTGDENRDGIQMRNIKPLPNEGRDGVRRAKAQLEFRLARNMKGKKKSFEYYLNCKRLNKENMDPIADWGG